MRFENSRPSASVDCSKSKKRKVCICRLLKNYKKVCPYIHALGFLDIPFECKAFTVAAARSFGTSPAAECVSFAIWKPSGACTAAVQQVAASLAQTFCQVAFQGGMRMERTTSPWPAASWGGQEEKNAGVPVCSVQPPTTCPSSIAIFL